MVSGHILTLNSISNLILQWFQYDVVFSKYVYHVVDIFICLCVYNFNFFDIFHIIPLLILQYI